MTGMQVIVGKVKDNWRQAYLKGNSSYHVLEKFSISMQCERRVIKTNDPNWPSVIVSGTLPKLVIHINEEKVFVVERMLRLILGESFGEKSRVSQVSIGVQTDDFNDQNMLDESFEESANPFAEWKPGQAVDELSKLLVLQFCIADLTVELQSQVLNHLQESDSLAINTFVLQGKSIAELQVTGVKAALTKRPFDTSISMSVHSLLLVDAIQTFGPNFELLLASHRHVMVDSVSGSLLGSEPVSPMSPGSPNPYVQRYVDTTTDLSHVLNSLQAGGYQRPARAVSPSVSSVRSLKSPPHIASPPLHRSTQDLSQSALTFDHQDHDALISISLTIIDPSSPSLESDDEELRKVSIQFNSLDLIANQETIVELLSFWKRIAPSTSNPRRSTTRVMASDQSCQTMDPAGSQFGSLTSIDTIKGCPQAGDVLHHASSDPAVHE